VRMRLLQNFGFTKKLNYNIEDGTRPEDTGWIRIGLI